MCVIYILFVYLFIYVHFNFQTRLAMELMNMDLKDERQAKLGLQSTVGQLELEIKKLKADLHVSQLEDNKGC